MPNIDQPTPLPVTVEAGKSVELELYLPSYAFPASRALFLLAVNGSYELSVNGENFGKPRKTASGNIFLMFMDQDTLNREPKADICGTFIVPTNVIHSGKNKLIVVNTGNESLTILRLDLGLWY